MTPTRSIDQPREEWQCRYRGAVCTAARAVKDDGTLHNLCSEHREKANLNQRKSKERKRRLHARLMESAAAKERTRKVPAPAKKQEDPKAYHALFEFYSRTNPSFVPHQYDGTELIPDDELFGPMLEELSEMELPLDDENLIDDLFRLIGPESDLLLEDPNQQ